MTNDMRHDCDNDDLDNMAEFGDLIGDIKTAGEVPEPSPLFWHHLSARVRDAVAEEPIARAWWSLYWRPLAAVVGSVGVVVFLLLRTGAPAVPTQPAAPVPADQVADVEVTEMWRMIEVAAPKVEMDSVRDTGLMPSRYATDQAIEALTPAEREALVRLLRKEIGASE